MLTTDLVQIRGLAAGKEAENVRFRRYLALHHHRVEELQSVAREVAPQIDCTECANCCRNSVVNVTGAEILSIAAYLGVDPDAVEHSYTERDPQDSSRRVLRSNADGCIFLNKDFCLIYECRPKPCRDFPHLALGTHSLGSRVSSLCRWAGLCPIIYHALEIYKHRLGFPSRRAS